MISNLKAFAFFAISTSPVYAELADMEFASGGSLCAAIDSDATIFIGKKGNSGCSASSLPTEYIAMKPEEFAYVKSGANAYLNDSALVETLEPATNAGHLTGLYYVGPTVDLIQPDENTEVAFANAGIFIGTPSSGANAAYGFVGTASYLVTKGKFTGITNNSFRIPGTDKDGIPVEDICIVDIVDVAGVATCDANDARTISTGDYKYSLYGYTQGDGYADYVSNNDFTNFGVRNAITTQHMKGSLDVTGDVEVSVNHAGAGFSGTPAETWKVSAIPASGFSGVQKLEIKGGSTTLRMDFPQKYNIGVVSTPPIPKKTKTVVINLAKNDNNGFYLDFVFEATEELASQNGYFVYDPSVIDGDALEPASNGAQGSSVAGVFSLMALSGVFLL